MKCPICYAECFINTWEGWIWVCPVCDKVKREATDAEIEELEE